jgi:hypothetical protein
MVVENNDNSGGFGCSLTWRIKGYGETGGRTSSVLVEVFMLFVEHLLRRSKLDIESAYPSYSVVFAMRSTTLCHRNIRRRSKIFSREI